MTATKSNQAVATIQPAQLPDGGDYEVALSKARDLALSDLVPASYKNKPANCLVAMNMAQRLGTDPMMVMQNLYIVHGNPAWSSQFMIASFNASGKFGPLQYEFTGERGKDSWGCRAFAVDLKTQAVLTGPEITIGLAKAEKWFSKSGSKWQTMPEMMLRYRAAAWFIRTTAPEIALGLQTKEEMEDVYTPSEYQRANAVTVAELTGQPAPSTDDADEDITDAELIDEEPNYLASDRAQEMIVQIGTITDRQSWTAIVTPIRAELEQYSESPVTAAVGKALRSKQAELKGAQEPARAEPERETDQPTSNDDTGGSDDFPGDLKEGETLL